MHSIEIVARVRSFIDEHYAEHIGAADVARALHYSPSHLTAVIRRLTGRPVGAWIIARRMAAARERLLRTDDSVASVAACVGFRDVAYFVRRFSRSHGTTPGRWRKAYVEEHNHNDLCPTCGGQGFLRAG
jgi:AraC family transcriptional activator of pobA